MMDDEELKSQLVNLGFHWRQVDKCIDKNPRLSGNIEGCLDWMLNNPVADDDHREFVVLDLCDIGFPEEDSRQAIDAVGLDLQRAVGWLSEQFMKKEAELQQQRDLQVDAQEQLSFLKRRSSELLDERVEHEELIEPMEEEKDESINSGSSDNDGNVELLIEEPDEAEKFALPNEIGLPVLGDDLHLLSFEDEEEKKEEHLDFHHENEVKEEFPFFDPGDFELDEAMGGDVVRMKSAPIDAEYILESDEESEEDWVQIKYGAVVTLQSVSRPDLFLTTASGEDLCEVKEWPSGDDEESYARETQAYEFILLNPANLKDVDEVGDNSVVALMTVDDCWVAAEVDNSVNANRSGYGGLFCTWKMKFVEDQEKSEFLETNMDVTFESALHNFLNITEDNTASAEIERSLFPGSECQWKIMLRKPASGKYADEKVERRDRKSGNALWQILRSNFRLAALRVLNLQVKAYKDEVERQRKKMSEVVSSDDKECIYCWEEERNTVILECGHICVCSTCMDDILEGGECPICRKAITRIVVIETE